MWQGQGGYYNNDQQQWNLQNQFTNPVSGNGRLNICEDYFIYYYFFISMVVAS